MRIGINGSNTLARADLGTINADIDRSEEAGFSSYWLAQTGLVDALTIFAGRAGTSGRSTMQLGTAVIPTWPRHPQMLAGQALTTQAMCGQRLILGIGLSHQPAVEGRWMMEWTKPVRHMIDYLEILNALLHEGRATHRGETWSFAGEFASPTDTPPKVMVAALGEQMLKVTGKRTDGTILWCVGPKTVEEHIAPVITAAADRAGRPAPSIVCSLPVWITDDPAPAHATLAKLLAGYAELPSYRAMLDIEGVHGLGELSLVGDEAEVQAGIDAIAAAGATDFTAVPMGRGDEGERTAEFLQKLT